MGAPEVLMVLFLFGIPAALGWCIWSLATNHRRRRNSRHDVAALGNVAEGWCSGSGQQAFWAGRNRGECPVCRGTVPLDAHPDGGPGAVLAQHQRTEP